VRELVRLKLIVGSVLKVRESMGSMKSSTEDQAEEVRSPRLRTSRPYCGPSDGDYRTVGYTDSFYRIAIQKLRASIAGWLFRRPLLYGWLSEARNFLRRISSPAELRAVYRYPFGQVDFGPVFEEVGIEYLCLCMKTQACIRDMQQTAQIAASPSLLDLQLYVDAWKQGAEWGLSEGRNRDSDQSPQPDQRA
jgi:hypothetical protein